LVVARLGVKWRLIPKLKRLHAIAALLKFFVPFIFLFLTMLESKHLGIASSHGVVTGGFV
jgi:hypothetical protein